MLMVSFQILLGAGGCLRDEYGNWIVGFFKYVSIGNVLQAELWAILLGLNLAIQLNLNMKLEIDTGSK